MKKIILIFLLLAASLVTVISAQAAFGIKLYIDGNEIECEVSPMIINDRTMVPVRVLFENFDADVEWDAAASQVHITARETDIVFTIGSKIAVVNGNNVTLDAAPMILRDRTLVPIRFVSENLGCKVSWDDVTKSVFITSPEEEAVSDIKLIEAIEGKKNTIVRIKLTEGVAPVITTASAPFRIILDFEKTSLSIKDGKNHLSDKYITEIRWASHDGYSRVVIETSGEQPYEISGEGTSDVEITVGNGTADTDSSFDEVTEPEENEEQEEQKNQAAQEELVPLPEFENMLIVIDAGHGGKDVGALAKDENGETLVDSNGNPLLVEKDVNLAISLKIRDRLQEKGIRVLMTRDDDSFTGTNKENLMARCEIANENNATLFVSVHNNSAVSPKATGTEICYTEESTGANGITSKELAQNILPYLTEATGLTDRGIVNRPNLVVLKNTAMPAVLLECGFLTCETDRKVLMDDNKLNDIAEGVATGIIKSMKQIAKNM